MIETGLFRSHFIPASKPSEKLMVVLHGRGDSLRPFKKFNEELNMPEMNFLLLNAPRRFMTGFSWYGEPPYQKVGVERIRGKLFQLFDELILLGWKPENIFLFGFSQGCLVSADFGLHYPRRLGGIIGISGYFCFFPRFEKKIEKAATQTPWLFTHGRKDDVLPIEETKFGVEKLKTLGLPIDWIESDKKHVIEEDELPKIRRWIRDQMSCL